MSQSLQITDAGLAEIARQEDLGFKAKVTHIAAGQAAYTPSKTQTSLVDEQERVPILQSEELSEFEKRLAGVFDGNKSYYVKEIGFYLESGVLLALYSHPTEIITYKAASTNWLCRFTLNLSTLPRDSVVIQTGSDNINLLMAHAFLQQTIALVATNTVAINQIHEHLKLSLQQH